MLSWYSQGLPAVFQLPWRVCRYGQLTPGGEETGSLRRPQAVAKVLNGSDRAGTCCVICCAACRVAFGKFDMSLGCLRGVVKHISMQAAIKSVELIKLLLACCVISMCVPVNTCVF